VSIALTKEQDLFIQSCYTFSLLLELHNNNLLKSTYFEGMVFRQPIIKDGLRTIGITNQGCALLGLYALVLIPHELFRTSSREWSEIYSVVDKYLDTYAKNTITNYKTDYPKVQYLSHIRNAVAHSSLEFSQGGVLIFRDKNKRAKESFSTELPLIHLNGLIEKLSCAQINYLNSLIYNG